MKTITLAQAIAAESRKPIAAVTFSHMQLEVTRAKPVARRTGEQLVRSRAGRFHVTRTPWKHNLTTDTATGYTNRRDFQAKAMGMGPSFAFATATAAPSAAITITGTTLTNSGAAFPTAGQALQGQIVAVYGLTNNSFVYGVILSNTATALTVDQWTNPASATGAVGTTPTTSGGSATTGVSYMILPGQNPASWLCLSSDATTPTSAYTALVAELTTNGFARQVGTWSHTAASTTYLLTKLFTASGTSTINTEGVAASATVSTGAFPFVAAETSPPTLVTGDTLTQNVTITIN